MLTELATTTEKLEDHQDREYQAFLVELAKRKNIIVCLPTGSGKTFIALLLAKHYLKPAIESNRKIVFLANTVPLVNQQAEYFKKHLSNQFLHEDSHHVECLTGDRQVDYWEPKKWKVVIRNCNVLVMTTQIFVDALGHGYISFSDVIFLILDECHHTDKDAPMNKVMEMYRDVLMTSEMKKLDLQKLPRILGLTATIINGKGKKIDVAREVEEAEKRLCARAVTYHKYEEVLKYSTCAKVEYVRYCSDENGSNKLWGDFDLSKPLRNFLTVLMSSNKEVFTEKLPDIFHPSFKNNDQRFNPKESDLKALKSLVKEVLDVFKDLGPYCAKIAAIHKRAYIQTKIDDLENKYTRLMMKALDTALTVFICQIERTMGKYDEAAQLQIFVTDKITKLTEILKNYDPDTYAAKKDEDFLSGLIFVQQRITAQALTWYLEDSARMPAYKFIKPGFVVGSATYGLDPVDARITATEQATVIRKSREYNLLVATRVLEEGLDVPACNLVIRFDKVHTYPSYVQSMGRARNKNSKFFGFIDKADEVAQIEQYAYFEKYNMQLSEYLKQNAIHADEEYEDDIRTTFVEKIIPNFEPNPGQSPRITALESISIAQRYCQTLPCDKLVTLSPVSWWEKVESNKYRAYVQFPSNAVIRDIVEGEVQETRMLAKRSAFLQACILLYQNKVLDEQLFPIPRRLNPMLNSFMENVTLEQDPQGRKVGSNKRTQHYYKKIPDCFRLGKILPGSKCKVYEIHVERSKPSTERDTGPISLYRFGERDYVYCIITPVDLSMIPQFILNVNPTIGNLVVSLNEIHLTDRPVGVELNQDEIDRLHNVQRFVFGELLKMKRDIMRPSNESAVLIAPLKRGPEKSHAIHWDLITELLELPEDFFNVPSDESRHRFIYKREDYEDAVVVPWYRGKERYFYTVVKISESETPMSPFPYNGTRDYKSYFVDKYPVVKDILDEKQALLKAKLISSNLNFFKTNISYKKTQEQRKDQRDSVVELVPELTTRHPLPASLYIQSKLLPSVIQRIHRFLCAYEIQKFVAKETPWNNFIEVRKDYMEELSNLICKNDPTETEPLCCKKGKLSGEPVDNKTPSDGSVKVQIHQPLLSNSNSEGEVTGKPVPQAGQSETFKKDLLQPNEPVLDFIHPRNLSLTQLDRIKDRSRGLRETRVRKSNDFRIDENNTTFDWKHDKESLIELISYDEVDKFLKERLDEKFTFAREKQPTLYTLMQSITMEASLDSVTLERLETIGDSFLKYCVSRHIFTHFPTLDEGKMTQWRSALVSNAHLYCIGKKLKLGEYLAAGIFRPDCAWLPPSFRIPELLSQVASENDLNDDVFTQCSLDELEKMSHEELTEFVKSNHSKAANVMPGNVGFTHGRVPDKSIADSVEALIGAYFIHGGQGGALHFMEKAGFRGPTSNGKELVPFGQWATSTPSYNAGKDSVSNHHSLLHELENVICYKFKEPWLLVEAFSHPCYMKNRVTDCYQRLEFLGDAVLDFLITNHIYKSGVLSPGELTDLRSALVNNVTFGSLSVRYGLETYLLNTDRRLQDAIDIFVECQKEANHQVTGHFKLLSDLDCHLVSDIDCPKVLGDIFESLAGAVFIDCGMSLDTVWKVFYRLMKNEIDLFSQNVPKSPVRELYESYPGRQIFCDITEQAVKAGAAKDPGMTYVALTVPIEDKHGNMQPVIGLGKSKQNAKLAAAKYANKFLKFHKEGIK